MAVLAIFQTKITKSQYEAIRKEIEWETQHPAGAVFHAAGFDAGDHLHVADVWESQESMMAFVENRLVPAMKKLGIEPPTPVVLPAHNVNAYKAIEKYSV